MQINTGGDTLLHVGSGQDRTESRPVNSVPDRQKPPDHVFCQRGHLLNGYHLRKSDHFKLLECTLINRRLRVMAVISSGYSAIVVPTSTSFAPLWRMTSGYEPAADFTACAEMMTSFF